MINDFFTNLTRLKTIYFKGCAIKNFMRVLILIITVGSTCAYATDYTVTVDGSQTFESTSVNTPAPPSGWGDGDLGGNFSCGMRWGTHTYFSQRIVTGTSASYTFEATSQDFDSFLVMYDSNGFDPANPAQNIAACNDDSNDLMPSITAALGAGEEYTLVTTTYGAGIISGDVSFTATPDITVLDVPPTLTLNKAVINDAGGQAVNTDWALSAAGPSLVTNVLSGTSTAVSAGDYTLSESGPDGYALDSLICDSPTDADPSDGLTLQLGQNVSCTFINDDIAPTLTLINTVVNDAGGTAVVSDWTLQAAGPVMVSGQGGMPETAVIAGNYVLAQSVIAGYALESLVCTGTADTDPMDGLTLAVGEDAICTFTSDDIAPVLTLEKEVINNDGRERVETDWTLEAVGPVTISGVEGEVAITAALVEAGTYTLSESGPRFYVQTMLVCTGAADGDPSDGLRLELAEVVSCVFTNDDMPFNIPALSPLGLLFLVSFLGFVGRRYQLK